MDLNCTVHLTSREISWLWDQLIQICCEKAVMKNFAKFIGNTCTRGFFINKPGAHPATLLRKRHNCLPLNFPNHFKIAFSKSPSEWLILLVTVWRDAQDAKFCPYSTLKIFRLTHCSTHWIQDQKWTYARYFWAQFIRLWVQWVVPLLLFWICLSSD